MAARFAATETKAGGAGAVALVAVALGAALRVQQYIVNRSLWLDEAMLTTNITGRGFAGLLKPLADTQGAPVLFLWAERVAVLVLGDNERALRLVPLVAGVAVVPLLYVAGRRLLGPRVGAAAAVLGAVSPALVRYSNEVKQYSGDAAVALVVVVLALRYLGGDRRALGWLAVVGVVAPWASHPAALVLAGTGVVLAWRPVRQRDWSTVRTLVAVAAAWAASLAVEYVVSLRAISDDDALRRGWQHGFVPRPFGAGSAARWLWDALAGFAGYPGGFRFAGLALAVALAGLVVLGRRRPVGLWVVLAPLLALLVAATFEVFPFEGRVVLFLVPLLLLAVAAPLGGGPWPVWPVAAAVVALVGIPTVVTSLDRVADPLPFPATREVLEYVHDHRRPGDELWLVDPATPPYRYYAHRIGVTAQRQLDWLPDAAACRAAGDRGLRPANVSGRVWVVHAYTYDGRPGRTGERVRSQLDALARRLDTHVDVDASATLYDFNALPSDVDGDRVIRAPGRACLRAVGLPPVAPTGLRSGPFGTGDAT